MNLFIKKLIAEGEHQQLDFKFSINDSRKIAKSLGAFSNTEGGRLLVGVKDNGVVAGVRSEEEFYMVQAAAQMYTRPEVKFDIHEWMVDGKKVMEFIIPKSKKKPHYVQEHDGKWLVYIRVNDQNLLANKTLLKVWQRKESNKETYIKYTEKEKILLDHLEKYKTISLTEFSRIADISKFKAETILVNFIVLDIIEMVVTEKGAWYQITGEFKKINPD